jgi:hypothetical protein
MVHRKRIIMIVVLGLLIAASSIQARELVLQPARIDSIVSPRDSRDARILVYFELPKELRGSKVVVDNAILTFRAQVTGAAFGMIHVSPLIRDWRSEGSVSWSSPWDSLGGDYAKNVAGRSVTLKSEKGEGEVRSNVTFIVKAWVDGSIANNGMAILPSEADLRNSAVRYSVDRNSIRLKVYVAD